MHFLGCLLFIFFGFVIIIIAFFGNILRLLFNVRKTTKQFKQAEKNSGNRQSTKQQEYTETSRNTKSSHHEKRKDGEKIFPKSEGEYVDFEEIKD